jgi:hypothetical protein
MSENTQLAVRPKASQQLAALIGMEPGAMIEAIKAQCFKGNAANITDSQLAAFVSIAADMGVNPFLPDMLYAFPGQGGSIIPIMGPAGVYKKLSEHPAVDSWESVCYPEDVSVPPTHAIARIWRKGVERPLVYTALLSEWKVGQNPNWASRPRHMLSLRALKHCARQVIHGIPYDADDRFIMEEINVTPAPSGAEKVIDPPKRTAPPKREAKGAATVTENTKATTTVLEAEILPPAAEPPAKPDTKPAARTALNDGEKLTALCTMIAVTTMEVKSGGVLTPSVSVELEGEFTGTVIHIGGATRDEDNLIPNPIWAKGKLLEVELLGKLTKAKSMIIIVQAVKEATPDTAPEVD